MNLLKQAEEIENKYDPFDLESFEALEQQAKRWIRFAYAKYFNREGYAFVGLPASCFSFYWLELGISALRKDKGYEIISYRENKYRVYKITYLPVYRKRTSQEITRDIASQVFGVL